VGWVEVGWGLGGRLDCDGFWGGMGPADVEELFGEWILDFGLGGFGGGVLENDVQGRAWGGEGWELGGARPGGLFGF
jgi:hypothetical protein